MPQSHFESGTAVLTNLTRDWRIVNAEAVPRHRLSIHDVVFTCPLPTRSENALQTDEFVIERRALSSASCQVSPLTETDHFHIGVDHAWDIARKIRIHVAW